MTHLLENRPGPQRDEQTRLSQAQQHVSQTGRHKHIRIQDQPKRHIGRLVGREPVAPTHLARSAVVSNVDPARILASLLGGKGIPYAAERGHATALSGIRAGSWVSRVDGPLDDAVVGVEGRLGCRDLLAPRAQAWSRQLGWPDTRLTSAESLGLDLTPWSQPWSPSRVARTVRRCVRMASWAASASRSVRASTMASCSPQ